MELGDANTTVGHLISQVREFLEERNWEKYHNPKDIAESISIEAAELLQLFQWVKPEESQKFKSDSSRVQQIREELADVVLYCLSMANTLGVDLTTAILDKIEQNKSKYPADIYRGRAYLNP